MKIILVHRVKLFLYFLVSFFIIYYLLFCIIAYTFKGAVILKPRCGIGNQLFQFAASYSLAKKTNSELYIIEGVKEDEHALDPLDRSYILDYFNIEDKDIKFTNSTFIKIVHWLGTHQINNWLNETLFGIKSVNERSFFTYHKTKNRGVLIINDYFESEIYFKDFKDEIIKQVTPRNLDIQNLQPLLEEVSKNNSVCIGDFLKDCFYETMLPIDYQKEAIRFANQIIPKANFFVFSDSLDFSKKELAGEDNLSFVGKGLSSLESLFLMSKCSHNIIANSTFSWWAAYLNQTKDHITIAPKFKYNQKFYQNIYDKQKSYWKKALMNSNAYPENWILLDKNNNVIPELIKTLQLDSEQEILENYHKKEFNIYTGKLEELNLCSDYTGKKYVCKVNVEDAAHSKITVVTAYYKIKSKFSAEQYEKWMQSFLQIPFNLVVYTDEESAPLIKKYRGDLPLKLIIRDFKKLYHYSFYEEYKKMYANDSNKQHSPELYIVWAEKVKFVIDAINNNYYNSDFFVWCDIGILRNSKYFSTQFPTLDYMTHNQISVGVINDFENYEIENKLVAYGGQVQRIAGNIQIGDIPSWKLYNIIRDRTLKEFMDNNIDSGNDQRVTGTIALRYPDFINLIYPSIDYKGNRWWYMLLKFSEKNGKL